MRDALHAAMRVGIVHFMAYPECLRGEGPVVETVRRILEDDFFGAIEVTQVKDPAARETVARLCAQSHVQVGYGAQPVLLTEKLNVNSLDPAERKRAVERMKACVEEAASLGATAFALLSGPNVAERREEAMQRLVDSLLEIGEACAAKGLRFLLADMAIQVEAARALTYRASAEHDAGRPSPALSAMAKCFASDVAMRVATDAVQVFGGYGFLKDYGVERLMRDAKITQIYEGTNQIMRVIVAKHLLVRSGSWDR